jgi:hypothetical protein
MRSQLMFSTGPEAEARRKRTLAAHKDDPGAVPDILAYGPETPSDDAARARFFGEA